MAPSSWMRNEGPEQELLAPSRRPHTPAQPYLKPQIPATSATRSELLRPPEAGGAVGNKRFYSWHNPLSQNWDSEPGCCQGLGTGPRPLPESLGLTRIYGTEVPLCGCLLPGQSPQPSHIQGTGTPWASSCCPNIAQRAGCRRPRSCLPRLSTSDAAATRHRHRLHGSPAPS